MDVDRHGLCRVQRGEGFGLLRGADLGREDGRGGIGGVAGHPGLEEAEGSEAVDLFHVHGMQLSGASLFAPDQYQTGKGETPMTKV
ncbi:hypothetical protein GCM10011324_15670 [Allosediminivita pacifica]|nr:hypothetical protein GCM10011324_15670 [Allosediminivita pacifica]